MHCDYLIIGGGIIGLNIAREIKLKYPSSDIILIEKEKDVALHSSGRNSGVLHAGFYYTADSLKAKFTKEGNTLLKQFCKQHNLKISNSQKVIVAKNQDELNGLYELKKRAIANDVDLYFIDEEELKVKFPDIKTYKKALISPNTATVNPKDVTLQFKKEIQKLGVKVLLNCKYKKRIEDNIILTSIGKIDAKMIINSAGLYADKIAKDFSFCKDYVIIPFKGIYLKDTNNKSNLKTNIYQVPNLKNPFLGVHYTLSVNNEAKIGPTAIPAFWRENYKGFDNFNLFEMIEILYYEIKLFLYNSFGFRSLAINEIKKYNLSHLKTLASKLYSNSELNSYSKWSKPGIRAQLLNTKTLELVQDFEVQADNKSIHILNAVSPAFTSSIPFAKHIVDKYINFT